MTDPFRGACPVLPVRDVEAALDHYRRLGFEAEAYRERDGAGAAFYGFLRRGPVRLHVGRFAELDPLTNTAACYLYVDDAEALFAEWTAAGTGGRFHAPTDTAYGLREFAHVDPDGNLIRVGSPLTRRIAPVAIDHVGLTVRDVERSVAFYRDLFGLEPAPDLPPHLTVLRSGDAELALVQWKPGEPLPGGGPDGEHFSLRFPPTDMPTMRERLAARGVEHEVVDTRIYLRDPDGHLVELEFWAR
jgi:catechol 2,3-dioxygenase-like lactoylglutathione lyase family enzyme